VTRSRRKGLNKVRARTQSSYTSDMSLAPVAPAWFRYVSWSFALLLLLCAGLQFNDPAPVRWIAVYAGAAAISVILPLRLRLHPLAVVVGMAAAIWCGYLAAPVVGLVSFSDLFTTMSEKSGLVERAHDAVGTALVSLWPAVNQPASHHWVRRPRRPNNGTNYSDRHWTKTRRGKCK
jgi:Transmembrane family 220, helix